MKQTILESRHDHQLLLDQSKYKKSNSFGSSEYARERQREQREQLDYLGLSEVEAVEYVLMLSRDEANANAKTTSSSGANTSETQVEEDHGMFEGDFDIEYNTDNDEGDDYNQSFTHSTFSGGRRSGTSSTSIPLAWSSSHSSLSSSGSLSSCSNHSMNRTTTTWSPTVAPHRFKPSPSSSNEKVQVSPPFRMEPMEAGQAWFVDCNAVGPSSGDADTSLGEEEGHVFPPIVPAETRNVVNEVQELKADKKPGKKKHRDRKDNIEDKRKDKPQTATMAEIPSPNPSSISVVDVGLNCTVNHNALTSLPSSSSTSPSASAWNTPLFASQSYGQRRASAIPSLSLTSTSASTSASASRRTAPRNAWTSGGPSLSARISPPTVSLHYHYHHQQQQGGRCVPGVNADMDEDLKLAIELSLVEARSRGEDV